MKKLVIAAAIVCAAAFAQAASVDWNSGAAAKYNGDMVYLLTSYASTYESLSAFEATAVDSAEIYAVSTRAYGTGAQTATGSAITTTAKYYFAMIDETDSNKIRIYDATTDMQALVYTEQEGTKGIYKGATASNIQAATIVATIQDVPEPTSAMLLLLGMAGLALKRKYA